MSQNYDCPNCGGAVTFQSSIAVWVVCPHCGSMVVRHDVSVEVIGQASSLPPDMSPLQIGASGVFDGVGFALLGRVRVAYEEGSWTEWFALFGDGRHGWVAEAQGFFMVSFATETPPGFRGGGGALETGNVWEIGGKSYVVADSKATTCLGGEGELPFVAKPGRKARSVDLGGAEGQFANAEISEEGVKLFVGRYARFDELQFGNLRAPPGWEEDPSQPKLGGTTSVQCPSCGAAMTLRAAGFTQSAACESCGALIDTATPDLTLIRSAESRQRIKPQIPLGKRGKLRGVIYEVIGFQHVDDGSGGWQEYLLFNPWQGFVWLVTYHGHWSFVERLFEQPAPHPGIAAREVVRFDGESFQLYDTADVRTDYVVGEFYWKVALGMKVKVKDFIRPPRVLSLESYPQSAEQTWSLGEYIEMEELEEAFNLKGQMREPYGLYLNQPNPFATKAQQLKWIAPLAVAALVLIQIISALRAGEQKAVEIGGSYQAGVSNAVVLSDPFEIKGGPQALEYVATAPVDNSWIELDIDLVNAETHRVQATREVVVEYYHGYDDGAWSEGKQRQEVIVPSAPPGKYYLTIETSADPKLMRAGFTVTVFRDVIIWSNFWIALGVVLIYPLYCWARSYNFERARWLESDYTPSIYFTSSASSDD